MGGAIRKRVEQMRANPANPTSKRAKLKVDGSKTKTGGLLGQNKTKTKVISPFGGDDKGIQKTKKRFGRTVETTRGATGKSKTVTKRDGEVTKRKTRRAAMGSMEMGGKVKAVKSYKKGGKAVAQGADKKDVRRERKGDRVMGRAAKKAKNIKTVGNRTVIKTKDEDKKRKTVYGGNQASRLVTKEKQRATKAGKAKGLSNIKDKVVDRKDFSVRRKTKGTTPNAGS